MCTADLKTLSKLAIEHPNIVHGDAAYGLMDAVDQCPMETISWFIHQGAPVLGQADDGYPLLHSCIERPQPDRYAIMKLLLGAGADINERGSNDWTPLHRAACIDDIKMIEILLDAGADSTIETNIDDYATAEMEARHLGKRRAADFIRDYRPVGIPKTT